jgi:NAD-dependent dihydropyrimidine dehydrogenase PreA subunit
MAIVVSQRECSGCALCVLVCPRDAMKVGPSFVVELDRERCDECRECLFCCPADALMEA